MKTGLSQINATTHRLVSRGDISDRIMEYLRDGTLTLGSRVFTTAALFGDMSLSSGGTDRINVVGTALATDGQGYFMDPESCTYLGEDFMSNVYFPNLLGITYYVGLARAQLPSGSATNSEGGNVEFLGWEEQIGVSADVDLAVDNGDNTMTFRLDSVAQGINAVGRRAWVWLKVPKSVSAYRALGTVTWDGVHSNVLVPHKFGQTTASTTASDYTVMLIGPTVRTTPITSSVQGVAAIGSVLGVGAGVAPSHFNTTGQNLANFSLTDLNATISAYSSAKLSTGSKAGPGAIMSGSPRYMMGQAEYNSLIYVFGGWNAIPIATAVAEVHSYNQATNAWTAKASIPAQSGIAAARAGTRCAVIGDKIYVVGGGDVLLDIASSIVQVYRPDTNTWDSPVTSMPAKRTRGSIGVIDGKIYYAGGLDEFGASKTTTYCYDPALNSWSTKAVLPATFHDQAYAVVGGYLYIVGGQKAGAVTSEMWKYDPIADSWTSVSAFALGITVDQSAATVINGMIHVAMGKDSTGKPFSCHFVYSPSADRWWRLPDPPLMGICAHAVGQIDGVLRVICGTWQGSAAIGTFAISSGNFGCDASQVKLAAGAGIATSCGKATPMWANATNTTLVGGPPVALVSTASCQLPDGSMFFTGGDVGAGVGSQLAWRWFPQTNTWQRYPNMTFARCRHGCVYHPGENAVYALAGITGGFSQANVERYSFSTGTWSTAIGAPDRYGFGQAHLVGDRVFMLGGGSAGIEPVTSGTAWNVRTGAVVATAALPAARRNPLSFAVPKATPGNSYDGNGANIFIFGGENAGNVQTTIYMLDTDTGAMVTHGSALVTARGYARCAPIAGHPTKCLIMGGVSPTTSATNKVAVYDFSLMTITELGTMAASRLHCESCEFEGVFYAITGASGTYGAPTAQATSYVYADISWNAPPKRKLRNFTNAHEADSVGFQATQAYGIAGWGPNVGQDMIVAGDRA